MPVIASMLCAASAHIFRALETHVLLLLPPRHMGIVGLDLRASLNRPAQCKHHKYCLMQGLERPPRLRQLSQACASAGFQVMPLPVVRQQGRVKRSIRQHISCYATAPAGVTSTLEKTQEARPLPTRTESVVDDPRLGNPLERQNRCVTVCSVLTYGAWTV